MRSRTLSVSIQRPPRDVYAFVSNPENLPRWATAFILSVRRSNDRWIVETPDGPMTIRFVDRNDLGVLDHSVTLRSGLEILNPMRVVANGAGSEVLFTLFQPPDMSDERYAEDARQVGRDLATLKVVLEA